MATKRTRRAYYTVSPQKETWGDLIDLEYLDARKMRLTVGAVNVRTGEMRYFDSRDEGVCIDHVLASGALPPAFPAVRTDGEDHSKDIDFTPDGIRTRRQVGYADTKAMLERASWNRPVDPIDGVVIHDPVTHRVPRLVRGVDGFAGKTK